MNFIRFAFVMLVSCAQTAIAAAGQTSIEGLANVIDGDTLVFEDAGERVRLFGIDAPEGGQMCEGADGKPYRCGSDAAAYLAVLVGRSGRVTCLWDERDAHGRAVAECVTSNGAVLNAEMVKAGWAVIFRRYSDGRYDLEEAEAKTYRLGLWAGRFIEPWEWRDGDRLSSERVAGRRGEPCRIKGNISGSNRIYHSPSQEHYADTSIDTSAGERWFCSAAQAEAAGWRPARR